MTFTGSRACGACPEPSSPTMAPPVSSASVAPDSGERTASSRPWITSTGQRTRAASFRAVSSSNVPPCVAISVSGVVCRPHADAVLDLLGRVRLGEDLREEEGQEAGVVAQPVVAVVLGPPLVGVQLGVEGGRRPSPWRLGRERHRGPDEDRALDPVGMVGRQNQSALAAHRVTDHEGAFGLRGVEDRDCVGRVLGLGVRLRLLGPVRQPVPAPVEGDHAEVPCEVGHLHLPRVRMDDRPGREQQHRLRAAAEDLVVDADAVALDVPLAVWVPRARLPAPDPVDRLH